MVDTFLFYVRILRVCPSIFLGRYIDWCIMNTCSYHISFLRVCPSSSLWRYIDWCIMNTCSVPYFFLQGLSIQLPGTLYWLMYNVYMFMPYFFPKDLSIQLPGTLYWLVYNEYMFSAIFLSKCTYYMIIIWFKLVSYNSFKILWEHWQHAYRPICVFNYIILLLKMGTISTFSISAHFSPHKLTILVAHFHSL